ncbi:error-prone DNA polymerase [Klenkia taihuensis]|uniref:Error-prone DNA polymerase n=1 Tax=Klenkia taihuensis TaxID=1225127 RepID=A0A1I1NSW8_9ACTN|nr:error-prone DNA polymerase [Klenkia taihuensis]GHE11952.1 error-prone DNA polymerase [Klenkia taihuensis]SFC96820.1 error-prone DNA polymerase [Klenkia taihuensis]
MGWQNPPIPWSELERTLSDRHRPGRPEQGDGGDSPAWSRKRQPYVPPADLLPRPPAQPVVPYAELHCHTNFSFLDGASHPEDLVAEAVRLGLSALAVTDHDGFYGVVRAAEAARAHGLRTVVGAELSLGLTGPQNGVADPEGTHLLVLARGTAGYHRLAAAITRAQLRGAEKGRPVYDLEELAADAGGDWLVLTGCRKGSVRSALATGGHDAAAAELDRLTALFGRDNVVAELVDHGHPTDSRTNDAVAGLAAAAGLPVVATGNVHVATPDGRRLAGALAAVRARRDLTGIDGWLPATGAAHLRSGAEMAARFARYPGAVARSVEIADALAFPLELARPKLPRMDLPPGHTPMSWLRELVARGAAARFGPPGTWSAAFERDYAQRVDRELDVIEAKDFPGYFLIVHDLVAYARQRGILCQGRGSAANSLVCYLLEITAVDPVRFGLPFERFLSTTRDEEPDIDVDFDSDRREEVIQYVYGRYGRRNAAQVANVITYRPKLAVRDVAKALGYSTGQQDAWSKQVETWGSVATTEEHDIPPAVVEMAEQLLGFPRHLGIHSGGMVLTDRPVGEVCPIEHARKEQRTVLQWDKDDCAAMGLVKFDLLGLGMLAALQYCFDLVADHTGERWTLDSVPKEEPGVYDMLCRADSVGVFQVESRAQMGTLPRLQPREFYHLVIDIALIRPGPIQGGAVHPFIRRKLGQEPVTYPHPLLEPVLARTLGVPLFQEQLMQIAVAVGGCTGDDADLLRRAMGSKRGKEKIGSLRATLFAGMASHGITGELAESIYAKIEAFANFGFAESHSISFALLVYTSSWFKLHYPAAFLAALLRAQPMGFYSPQTLVADARRHGVQVLTPDVLRSGVHADLERTDDGPRPVGPAACRAPDQPPTGEFDPHAPFDTADHRLDEGFAVRLGLAGVRSIGEADAERVVAARDEGGPFTSLADLVLRTGLTAPQLEALATAGAFDGLGLTRRQALWEAGRAAQERADRLPGSGVVEPPPMLPGMSPAEETMADLWATAISPASHPVQHVRAQLDAAGVLPASGLLTATSGTRVRVGGVVTHRQRPATAGGTTFLNLEDETGLVNVIVSTGVWARHRRVARESSALVVHGRLERNAGVVNLVAERLEKLAITARTTSRDFR